MSLLSRLAVQAARAYGILSSADKTKVVADYLVVAGGGSGGGGNYVAYAAGGGGAGGLRTSTATLSTLNTYSIVVGAGATSTTSNGVTNPAGSNSSISGTGLTTITAAGGGSGAPANGSAGSGGSGGGGTGTTGQGSGNTPSTSPSQGNNGGSGTTSGPSYGGGGGGGASAVGANATTTAAGNGGAGTASSISGSSVTYAGGGGGGIQGGSTPGTGGAGGGGNGGALGAVGNNGTANRGGGGGGCSADSATNILGGNGGSGIVIISYTSATPKFVGGTITTSGGKQIHTFTSSGTLSPITPITASYLVVAGGGGAVGNRSGGGGAGGLLTSSTTLYSGATYIVTIGAGGAGGAGTAGVSSTQDGSNSVLSGTGLTTITATGGGGGGGTNNPSSGRSGGSGGGAGGDNATGATGGSGTSGQGFAGGTSATGGGGGGGGASAVGSNGSSNTGGNGGAGTSSSISGTSVTYAGGGGGGATTTAGTGGAGGGGNGAGGSPSTQSRGVDGTQNSGGGAGGGSNYATTPVTQASGGSGIVIISYAGSQVFNGGLVTSSGGNTIHTFTSTGALTPLTNNLNNSLRFRSSASAYLSRTPTLAGNRNTWTFSAWVKKTPLASGVQAMIAAGVSTTVYDDFCFENDQIRFVFNNGTYDVKTTQVFRDPSAWYHIVVAMDTTQATAANRTKIYVNGNQVTAFATANYPAQNHNTNINNTILNTIGNLYNGSFSSYFDGYMTDINFIDGQALEPYYFGNNDANGVWKPIQYKGTYGTNGFYLTFGNTTSTTTLGYDSSPNGNNWTCNNISLTAGTTYDAMTDVPTNTSATVANYAVLNPLWKGSVLTLAGANLNVTSSGIGGTAISTMDMSSGKYYCEVTVNTGSDATIIGIVNSSFNPTTTSLTSAGAVGYYGNNGDKFVNGTQTSYGASYTTGNVIGIALDVDAGTVTFYKNNTSQGAITHGLTGPFYFATSDVSSGSNIDQSFNFGQRPFSYTPPTGYVALNTYNLPTPTILQGNKYMDATLYTQNGAASNVVVNEGQFKPDLVWIKCRTTAGTWNNLVDSVRGVSKTVYSNSTSAEGTDNYLSSFNSNGFTLNIGDSGTNNTAGRTQVAWNWQAGQGSTSSNTSGSITSTVSVNTTAGFSIVTYTGTGANATVGHGLGVAPKMIIAKGRGNVDNWPVYHASANASPATGHLLLNTTAAFTSTSSTWNNTAPTSTVFTIGTDTRINQNTIGYVAYCFAEISGYSKFGSYTGNGSTNGPFIYLGFRPKFILVKNTQAVQNWRIVDTSRSTYNQTIGMLEPSSSAAEYTDVGNSDYDIVSNGFKIRNTGGMNNNNETHIFMAFAEHPFKNSNAR